MAAAGRDSRGDKVEITGLRRTVRQLKELDAEIGPELKRAGLEAAEIVREAALERVPVGSAPNDKHPGKLKATLRATGSLYGAKVRAGGAATPYAPPVHWGWAIRHIRPQPFLYEALDSRRPAVLETYEHQIKALIARTVDGRGAD